MVILMFKVECIAFTNGDLILSMQSFSLRVKFIPRKLTISKESFYKSPHMYITMR